MFTNLTAIKTLVDTDPTATSVEKWSINEILSGKFPADTTSNTPEKVVSFTRAASMLGYKSTAGVYKAIQTGRLKGYYGGAKRRRSSGVLLSSITEALAFKN